MIFFYSHKITPRLTYIVKQLFYEFLNIKVSFTTNKEEFIESDKIKINYSNANFNSGLFFQSNSLLFENGISDVSLIFSTYKNKPCFFSVGESSSMNFDVFAASFYLLSRYEEYLPHKRDIYERFSATESIAYKKDFLQEPLIDFWVIELYNILKKKYPELPNRERKYSFINTIDIDNAYAYLNKGLIRTIGGYSKSLLELDFKGLKQRSNVLLSREKDPYDTYDFLKEIQQRYNLNTIYFFLLADYGFNDKNISPFNKNFKNLIKDISDYADTGIHPSFNSNDIIDILEIEKNRLEDITKQETNKSRQHFLKINLPKTYQNLVELDIKEDYSMGYADQIGFRASSSNPFYFYNLDTETQTQLKIIPFCVMEATLKYYLKLTPIQALDQTKSIIEKVKNVNGSFVSLWHNETLSNQGVWTGWKMVYESMIKHAI